MFPTSVTFGDTFSPGRRLGWEKSILRFAFGVLRADVVIGPYDEESIVHLAFCILHCLLVGQQGQGGKGIGGEVLAPFYHRGGLPQAQVAGNRQ